MALDDLQIVIDVLDSFSDELDELLADLETVDIQADRVDDIFINLHTTGETDVAELQAQLSTLNNENISVAVDTLGEEQLVELAALKETVGADEHATVNIDVDGFGELAAAQSQVATLRAMAAGDININGGGGGGGVNTPARGDMPEGGLLNVRMSDLHNVLARLVPLIVMYIGALPAVIGGVVALGAAAVSAAAALGALGGLSLLGFAMAEGDGDVMEGLSEIADRVQEDFMDAFGPIAEELAPLFEEGLDGLERFFDALASHGDILIGLQDEARRFGHFLSEYIVGTAASMGQLTETATPLFALIGQVVEDLNLLEGLAGFLAQVLPHLWAFSAAFAELVVTITKVSGGFLAVATIITQIISTFFEIVTVFGLFDEQVGAVIGSLLALWTISSILYGLYNSQFLVAVYKSAAGLYNMGLSAIFAAGKQRIMAVATMILQASVMQLARAVAIATAGLAVLLGVGSVVASQFGQTSSAIDEAADSLREFQNIQGNLDGTGAGGSTVFQFNPTTRQTQINANSVEEGKRAATYQEWEQNNSAVTQ